MHRISTAARLAARRAELATLDINAITACERAAGQGRRGRLPPPDPARWDRSTWHRYLTEARAQEYLLAARRRRLLAEIGEMERGDVPRAHRGRSDDQRLRTHSANAGRR